MESYFGEGSIRRRLRPKREGLKFVPLSRKQDCCGSRGLGVGWGLGSGARGLGFWIWAPLEPSHVLGCHEQPWLKTFWSLKSNRGLGRGSQEQPWLGLGSQEQPYPENFSGLMSNRGRS